MRGSYVDNVRDIVSPCHDRYLEEKECARTGELDDSKKHRNTFSIGVEEDHVDEGEDVDNDVVDEEEEEDMPFAWVDHLMTATQSFNVKTKIFGPAGDKEAERESFLAEGKVGSGPPSIQIGVGYSYNIPPALISFPDAPWYESGSAVSQADDDGNIFVHCRVLIRYIFQPTSFQLTFLTTFIFCQNRLL